MATIPTLQLPGNYNINSNYDFATPLAALSKAWTNNSDASNRQAAMAPIAQQLKDTGKITDFSSLINNPDPSLIQLGQKWMQQQTENDAAAAQAAATQAYRGSSLANEQARIGLETRRVDLAEDKTPTGWEKTDDPAFAKYGGYKPIAAQTPGYKADVASEEARAKGDLPTVVGSGSSVVIPNKLGQPAAAATPTVASPLSTAPANFAQRFSSTDPSVAAPPPAAPGTPVLPPGVLFSNKTQSGGGLMSDDAVDLVAQRVLAQDPKALVGFGRNSAARIQIENRVADLAKQQNVDATELLNRAAQNAERMAAARTTGTRKSGYEIASNELGMALPVAQTAIDKLPLTRFPAFNKAIQAGSAAVGDPDLKAATIALETVARAYARATSPTGTARVDDLHNARSLMATWDSPQAMKAGLQQMAVEAAISGKAFKKVDQDLYGGGGTGDQTSVTPDNVPFKIK